MSEDRPDSPPVFVDASGRRRRTTRNVAVVCAAAVCAALALVVAALFGAPLGPLTVLPTPTVLDGPTAPSSAPRTPHRPVPGTGSPDTSAQSSTSGSPVVVTDSAAPTTTTTPPGRGIAGQSSTPGHGSHGTGKPTTHPTPPSRSR